MPGSEVVQQRIEGLISEANGLFVLRDRSLQKAWLAAAQNAIQMVCPSSASPYRVQAQRIFDRPPTADLITDFVADIAAILRELRRDMECGLLTTVENRAIAVTFDDFLDHGAEYLKHGRKDEAAVIAGIVFEDTIRRICRVLEIPENGVPLDALISELTKRNVLTALKAKRARGAAGLRTSAAHARWEEIQLSDVQPVIELTRELMAAHRLGTPRRMPAGGSDP
jgi:hypothetical protein